MIENDKKKEKMIKKMKNNPLFIILYRIYIYQTRRKIISKRDEGKDYTEMVRGKDNGKLIYRNNV